MSDSEKPDSISPAAGSSVPVDEPRARDIVRGEVSEQELDPVTVAQLAAWFGAPATSFDDAPGSHARADRVRGDDAPWLHREDEELSLDEPDDRTRLYRRIDEAADQEFLARLESKTHAGDAFIRLPEPLTLPIERKLSKLDLDIWRVHVIDTRDWERPDDVVEGLAESVPQAILRDLHRPVLEWRTLFLSHDLGVDIAGARSTSNIHELMATPQRVRMSNYAIASHDAAATMTDLRAHIDEPWDEIEIPEERRAGMSTRTPEDFLWFGSVGYDPEL